MNLIRVMQTFMFMGVLLITQGALACEKPQTNHYDKVFCLSEGLAKVEKDGVVFKINQQFQRIN